jgi:hypothetical protein
MASTYSDLKFELIGTGEQSGTWGTTTNTNLGTAIQEAITGSADVTFASGTVTLTLTDTNASQTARNLRLNLTGTSGGAQDLIVPTIEKFYLVNNGCADAITVKNSTGTGIAVPAGKAMLVFNNGTNVVEGITYITALETSTATIGTLTLTNDLAIAQGGTGASTADTALDNLGGTTVGKAVFKAANAAAAQQAMDTEVGVDVQAYDAGLTDIAGLAVTDGNIIVGDGTNWVAENGATARTSLGLGSIATQASSSVTITGGSITGITDLAVADGGTGASSFTANNVLLGNDTSSFGEVAPGTSGNVLTSDGTTWTSAAAGGGGGALRTQLFVTPGTWTKPATTSSVKVTVIGGGGGGASPNTGGGLNPTQNGGTSSFGAFVSATGGQGGRRVPTGIAGTSGTGTVSSGTAISAMSGNVFTALGTDTPTNFPATSEIMMFGDAYGAGHPNNTSPSPGTNPYVAVKTTSTNKGMAGMYGQGALRGGFGGVAMANITAPLLPGPVAVTVGDSGARGPGPSVCYGGTGGVVIVEWIES